MRSAAEIIKQQLVEQEAYEREIERRMPLVFEELMEAPAKLMALLEDRADVNLWYAARPIRFAALTTAAPNRATRQPSQREISDFASFCEIALADYLREEAIALLERERESNQRQRLVAGF